MKTRGLVPRRVIVSLRPSRLVTWFYLLSRPSRNHYIPRTISISCRYSLAGTRTRRHSHSPAAARSGLLMIQVCSSQLCRFAAANGQAASGQLLPSLYRTPTTAAPPARRASSPLLSLDHVKRTPRRDVTAARGPITDGRPQALRGTRCRYQQVTAKLPTISAFLREKGPRVGSPPAGRDGVRSLRPTAAPPSALSRLCVCTTVYVCMYVLLACRGVIRPQFRTPYLRFPCGVLL